MVILAFSESAGLLMTLKRGAGTGTAAGSLEDSARLTPQRKELPMRRALVLTLLALLALCAIATAQPRVVRYEPKESDLKLVYGPAPPVALLAMSTLLSTVRAGRSPLR